MEIEFINYESYRALQIAQTTYVLALREMALIDHISVACMCRLSKEEALRLSSTPIHVIEAIFVQLPPMLNFNGVKGNNGKTTHSIIDLFNAIDENDSNGSRVSNVAITAQHLLALNTKVVRNKNAGN
ncbi:hypothetical protein [Photobacterium carnosum]|uniref:Uncharacterized protein n=2 Tax=Vibrionaceae TaxID=641 RepID=A0A2N4UW92_9GAMM|nr:hypothetical protein [Photobacterium carnosum]PLC59279.1 hypothetical protein CIK00_03150 [Photobacterium carnosum]